MTTFTDIKKYESETTIDADAVLKRISPSSNPDSRQVHMIPLSLIFPNPNQPRKTFDESSLIRLADSIRKYGILHPITVRPFVMENNDQYYEIVIGERRFRSAEMLKLESIPCIIVKSDPKLCFELAIIENIQREDLNCFEQASAIASLIQSCRLTQEEAAGRLSVSQSYIANKLRLLKLSLTERELVLSYGLTERHARALLKLPTHEMRINAIEHIHSKSLNVAGAEAYIDKMLNTAIKSEQPSKRLILKDIRIFYNTIDKAVSIVKQAGIEIISERLDCDDGSSTLTIKIPKTIDVSRET